MLGSDHSKTMSLGCISIGSNFSTLPGTDSFVVNMAETGRDLRRMLDSVPLRTTTVNV